MSRTGLSFFDSLRELVFEPLGIRDVAEWSEISDLVPGYDPNWVYSGTFLIEEQTFMNSFAALAKHRQLTIGLKAGLTEVSYANTGFDNPGYNYGFMVDGGSEGESVKYVGHGGGGPGFNMFALVDVDTWHSALHVSTEEFDQAQVIRDLKTALNSPSR